LTKKKASWDGQRNEANQSFTKIREFDWEDGWHFVRVLPINADGDMLPIVNSAGDSIPVVGDPDVCDAPHESDLFYVIRNDDVMIDVPQRAVPKFATLQHAIISKMYAALTAGGLAEEPVPVLANMQIANGGGDLAESFEFRFPGEGFINIPLTRPLRQLEEAILAEPRSLSRWSLLLHHANSADISNTPINLTSSEALDTFLDARDVLFQTIRDVESGGHGIVELTRMANIEDEVLAYAGAYSHLVATALRHMEGAAEDNIKDSLQALHVILAVDTVAVRLTDFRGGQRTAYLASPTHPLRILWLSCWSKLAMAWAHELAAGKAVMAPSVKLSLFESLALVNFPVCLTGQSGRLLHFNDNIHALWSVYSAADEPDPRGLIAELCTALKLPEPVVGGFSLDGDYLAGRIRRYVAQHPYVQTLVLNCFNVGRGKIVADALLGLQRLPDTRSLRYEIRLFSENPEAPGIGEDLSDLISPASSQAAAEADVFSIPTGDHLSPKLTFAQISTSSFQENPSLYPAHITMLLDIFPEQTVSARPPAGHSEGSSVYGLLQEFSILYEESNDRVAWHKSPRHGEALPLPGSKEMSDLFNRLAGLMSTAAAAVATGQGGVALRPVTTLVLGPREKALLHQVHEVSDWVFTIDRCMGVEFFEHKPGSGRQEYLIDHSPNYSSSSGRRVVITSRSHTEICRMFEGVLSEHGLDIYTSRAASLLAELRCLSGRLALKLVSASTHRAEALGLALGKLFLEYQGAFRHQAIIPLDSHTDLLRSVQASISDLSDEISLKRTDLALFDFDWSRKLLTCRLVEVKCYKNAGGSLESLKGLKISIAEQLDASEHAIRKAFNQEIAPELARPDRVLRSRQFRNLLEFYVERADRLGLMSPDASCEAKAFLQLMEQEYAIAFTKSAVIFDFEKQGMDESLEDDGIHYHRIGRELIAMLVEALPAESFGVDTLAFPDHQAMGDAGLQARSVDTNEELRTRNFPLISSAVFLAPDRDRTVTLAEPPLTTPKTLPNNNDQSPTKSVSSISAQPEISPLGVPPAVLSPQADTPDVEGPLPLAETAPTLKLNLTDGFTETTVVTSLPDILLGCTGESPQYGHLAKVHGRSIALDLNQTQTISLFGVQGGGKSYTLGSIIEMATMSIPGINLLPQPLATVVFHYSQTQDYKPEFTSLNKANDDQCAIRSLLDEYGTHPQALPDIVLLTPEGKVAARRAEYPDLEVLPLKFASSELQAGHWRFLMGAIGNQATYIRRLNQVMRSMRDSLTLEGLRAAVEGAGFGDNLRDLALMRLDLAAAYIDDNVRISDIIRPGRLVIVDLRDEFIEKDEALGLFVVLLQLFSDATDNGRFFNKLVVFDEAHKYIDSPDLVEGLIGVVREMRHKGTSILVASQDPPSVPVSLIELSTQIILHRLNSPAWLKHIQKANTALSGLQSEQLSRLKAGEAFLWSAKSTDRAFFTEAIKVSCRSRVTYHGGATKTAV
jgi:hypothetical protein